MRLLEAIIAANHAAAEGRSGEVQLDLFADALPLAALTCIDPRLNKLFPDALGLRDEHFIWLRNAGNVITGPTSSTARSVALSIYIKGVKEIAVIGHTDCKMSQLTMMGLLDRLQEHGIDRNALHMPNLQEFFGLFGSEQQNVIKGCGFLRQSPIIPQKIPVHGLMINTTTGRLDWIVNGYETLGNPVAGVPTLKEIVTGHLPDGTPIIVSSALGQLADKVEPLVAKEWEAITAKIGGESRAVGESEEPVLPPKLPPPPPPIVMHGKDSKQRPSIHVKRTDPWAKK